MAKANNTSYYVYLHRKKSNGQVFYVGKGHGNRAFDKYKRNAHWKNTAAKHGYTIDIYQDGLQEWYAFELEQNLISLYGRENLCNMTDGGDGGLNPSFETRIKMSENNFMKKNLLFFVGDKNPFFGKTHSEKVRRNLSKSMTERNKMIGNPMLGKKREDVSGSRNHKAKRIICIETKMEFDCIRFAEKWLFDNFAKKGDIYACVRGKKKTSCGYKWAYANNA